MEVALIDDGISYNLYNINKLCFNIEIKEDLSIKTVDYDIDDSLGHGTICAAIIRKYCKNANIGSIKIIHEGNRENSCDRLIVALNWCLEHNIKLIHMSIGTNSLYNYEKLRVVVSKLMQNGSVLVAAFSNNGKYTIPACFAGVIGVATNKCENNDISAIYDVNQRIGFLACSKHKLYLDKQEEILSQRSNSYAAPYVTALVYKYLQVNNRFTSYKMKQLLYQKSNKTTEITKFSFRPDFISDAIYIDCSRKEDKNAYNDFFFECKQYVTLDKLEQLNLSNNSYLVIMPSEDNSINNKVYDYINNNKNLIAGIMYTGYLDYNLREKYTSLECYLWSMDRYNYLIESIVKKNQELDKNKSDEILKIGILTNEEDISIKFSCELNKMFINDGYFSGTTVLFETNRAFLYNVNYKPDSVDNISYIENMVNTFNLDLIIGCYKDRSYDSMFDFILSLTQNPNVSFSESSIEIPYNYTDNDIKKVLEYIVSECEQE